MEAKKIIGYAKAGKFILFIDDKKDLPLTPKYLEENTLAIIGSKEYGFDLCRKLQENERNRTGKATTRYRISSALESCVCTEDLEKEVLDTAISYSPGSELQKN